MNSTRVFAAEAEVLTATPDRSNRNTRPRPTPAVSTTPTDEARAAIQRWLDAREAEAEAEDACNQALNAHDRFLAEHAANMEALEKTASRSRARAEWATERLAAVILSADPALSAVDKGRPLTRRWKERGILGDDGAAYVLIPREAPDFEVKDGEPGDPHYEGSTVIRVPLGSLVDLRERPEENGRLGVVGAIPPSLAPDLEPVVPPAPEPEDEPDEPVYSVIEGDAEVRRSDPGETLAELLDHTASHFDADKAIWSDGRLVGVVRRREDGAIEATDFLAEPEPSKGAAPRSEPDDGDESDGHAEARRSTYLRRGFFATECDITVETSGRRSLDEFLAGIAEDFRPDEDHEMCVWWRGRIAAVVRVNGLNETEIVRFDYDKRPADRLGS